MQHPILGVVAAGTEDIMAIEATRAAFTILDKVDLIETFAKRARLLKSSFAFLQGALRSCLRLARQEPECGRAEFNEIQRSCCSFFATNGVASIISWRRDLQEEIAGTVSSREESGYSEL